MLGRLFVENFDLRRKRRAQGEIGCSVAECQGVAALSRGPRLFLNKDHIFLITTI